MSRGSLKRKTTRERVGFLAQGKVQALSRRMSASIPAHDWRSVDVRIASKDHLSVSAVAEPERGGGGGEGGRFMPGPAFCRGPLVCTHYRWMHASAPHGGKVDAVSPTPSVRHCSIPSSFCQLCLSASPPHGSQGSLTRRVVGFLTQPTAVGTHACNLPSEHLGGSLLLPVAGLSQETSRYADASRVICARLETGVPRLAGYPGRRLFRTWSDWSAPLRPADANRWMACHSMPEEIVTCTHTMCARLYHVCELTCHEPRAHRPRILLSICYQCNS